MTIEYSLGKQDLLTLQLYIASQSERIRKRRLRGKYLYPILYFLIALFPLSRSGFYSSLPIIAISILWFIFYPMWEKRYYFKHYERFTDEILKSERDPRVKISFENNFIATSDSAGDSNLLYSAFVSITELTELLIIQLPRNQRIAIPKKQIADPAANIATLKSIAHEYKIPFTTNLNWSWKQF